MLIDKRKYSMYKSNTIFILSGYTHRYRLLYYKQEYNENDDEADANAGGGNRRGGVDEVTRSGRGPLRKTLMILPPPSFPDRLTLKETPSGTGEEQR